MIRKLVAIVMLSPCFSFTQNLPVTRANLFGDWVNYSESNHGFQGGYGFSFADTLCSPFHIGRHYEKFVFKKNKIAIQSHISNCMENYFEFEVKLLTADSLILIPSMDTKRCLKKSNWFYHPSYHFNKIKPKHSKVPKLISFASSGCFGYCPSIKLEIYNDKKVRYHGGSYADPEGIFEGTIPSRIWKYVVFKIQQLPLSKIAPKYTAGWTDDQTSATAIVFENDTTTANVYGWSKEPIELRIYINMMLSIVPYLDIAPSTNLKKEDFAFPDLLSSFRLPEDVIPIPVIDDLIPPPDSDE